MSRGTLLRLRHATSDWSDHELSKHNRPLQQRDKRDAERMSRVLTDEDLTPDLILISTAKRARQMVERVVSPSDCSGTVEETRAFSLADPMASIQVLREGQDT